MMKKKIFITSFIVLVLLAIPINAECNQTYNLAEYVRYNDSQNYTITTSGTITETCNDGTARTGVIIGLSIFALLFIGVGAYLFYKKEDNKQE